MEDVHFCPKCGSQVPDNVMYCPHCGAPLNPTGEEEEKKEVKYIPVKASSGKYAIAGLIFGIMSVVLGGYLWSILGLVFSKKDKDYDGKAKAGYILSIIGLVISTIYLIYIIVVLTTADFHGM